MTDHQKLLRIIARLTLAFWIIMKLISFKLWTTDRLYPIVPLIPLPSTAHIVLYLLFFPLAAWLLYKPTDRKIIWILLITEVLLTLADQTRLQPWHYQYWFTFLAIVLNFKRPEKTIQAFVLIIVSTYFFSGLSKFNPGFIDSVWSIHILHRFMHVPTHYIHHPLIQLMGYTLPIMEFAGALLLLSRRTMAVGAWSIIAMHVFILFFMGPLGINYNRVVWPWNLQMPFELYLLFIAQKQVFRPREIWKGWNSIVAFFWLIMPIVGLTGHWDKFLSSAMYSGRKKMPQLKFKNRNNIPMELRPFAFYSAKDSSARIVITDWTMIEMEVAAVTEDRVINSVLRQLNDRYSKRGLHFRISTASY